jgi:hypothetical protein
LQNVHSISVSFHSSSNLSTRASIIKRIPFIHIDFQQAKEEVKMDENEELMAKALEAEEELKQLDNCTRHTESLMKVSLFHSLINSFLLFIGYC